MALGNAFRGKLASFDHRISTVTAEKKHSISHHEHGTSVPEVIPLIVEEHPHKPSDSSDSSQSEVEPFES